MEKFSERLRFYMEQKGLKQADLVERTGINKSSISEYLSGNYEPKQRNIYKIAMALGVKPSQLMGVADEEAAPRRGNLFALSAEEMALIQKYRQLDNDGRFRINKAIEAELELLSSKAEEGAVNCG